MIRFAVAITIAIVAPQVPSIGASLAPGVSLVYVANGTRQTWNYETVEVVARDGFSRCVVVTREGMAPRESCARGDTLFEPDAGGALRPSRPIGAGMTLSVPLASGSTLEYETHRSRVRRVDDAEFYMVETSIVTRDREGVETRRLREHYAPALLTAADGIFEEPDGAGGWRVTQSFYLLAVRAPETPGR